MTQSKINPNLHIAQISEGHDETIVLKLITSSSVMKALEKLEAQNFEVELMNTKNAEVVVKTLDNAVQDIKNKLEKVEEREEKLKGFWKRKHFTPY